MLDQNIDIRQHFERDLVQNNCVLISHVGTEDMVTDILTKALPAGKFQECRNKLGLRDFNSSGGIGLKT